MPNKKPRSGFTPSANAGVEAPDSRRTYLTAERKVWFGFGAAADARHAAETVSLGQQADRDGLDLFCVPDHPYSGRRLDAYATVGFILGRTSAVTGLVDVTNLPTRPAPMLARALTSLSWLYDGRLVLGIGAGGYWDAIVKMGVPRLTPGSAVTALEEAITLVRLLSSGGPPVTFEGKHYQVTGIEPAPASAPPVWTGSVGPRSLAVTGRLADGWIPGRASDWMSDLYRTSRPVIDEAATAAGRDPTGIATVYHLTGEVTVRDQPRTCGKSCRPFARRSRNRRCPLPPQTHRRCRRSPPSPGNCRHSCSATLPTKRTNSTTA